MSPSPDQPPFDGASEASGEELHRSAAAELSNHALGLPLPPDLREHVRGCSRCRDELDTYRTITRLARADVPDPADRGADHAAATPPPRVWARIEAELAETDPPLAAVRPSAAWPARVASPGRSRARTAILSLLAAAAVVAAAVGGWTVATVRSSDVAATAQAGLTAQPGTPAAAHGRATMHAAADGLQMQVTTAGLPEPAGYYQVWLYDPSADTMVAVGTLGAAERGTFTLPTGIDTRAYNTVDISEQHYDGNPAHELSVLRGRLGTT